MRIGLYFDDLSYKGKDFRTPENGNPGIGGTPYCFLMLAKYYKEQYPNDCLLFYHQASNEQNKFSKETEPIILAPENIASKCIEDKVDFLVLTLSRYKNIAEQLERNKIKCIVWVHNFLSLENLLLLRKNESATRVVFVGKEQYDRYIDDVLIKKSVCIMNMYNTECDEYKRENSNTRNVIFTGAIVPGKGFHYLAKYWKKIIAKVPDAVLYVMGTGALYNNNAKLGKYGIAEESYENQFMKYLLDENGEIIPSVHFLGIVGPEKINYYQNARLGIINPTARTEICPISVLEMASCEIPVVSRNKNGMPDVIENNATGLLVNNSKEFCDAVVKLLLDDELNLQYGKAAKRFVYNQFSPIKIAKEWHDLFEDMHNDRYPSYQKPTCNFTNNFKFIRVFNRVVRSIPLLKWLPSMAWVECKIKACLIR